MAVFGSSGFAKASHFEIQVFGPILGTGISDVSSVIPFRCSGVSIPGRDITTTSYRTYGPIQRIANDATYPEVAATITMSEDLSEKLFFQRWQDFAVGFARGMDGSESGMFDIGYYSEYIGTVVIRQFSEDGALTYECALLEAYPIRVADLAADWNTDAPHQLSVQFAYRYFVDDPGWKDAVDDAFADIFAEEASALGLLGAGGAGTPDIGIDPGVDAQLGLSPSTVPGSGSPGGEVETIIISPTNEQIA